MDIANLKFQLCFSKTEWRDLFSRKFSGFLTEDHTSNPDMKIVISFINSHRAGDTKFRYVDQKTTQISFPDSFRHFQLLNFAIKNCFSGILLRRQGCFIHASAAELNGRAMLFAGVSGQGKSSIVRDLGCRILADDRSIIRWGEKQPFVYGSPFYEQHNFLKSKVAFPLAAIFMLGKRTTANFSAQKLTKREAIFSLIPHVVIREEESEEGKAIQLKLGMEASQLLAETVLIYQLYRPLNLNGLSLRRSLNEIIG